MLVAFLLLTAAPQAATDLLRQALAELQAGQTQQAQDHLIEAKRLEPANALVWSSLAETHRRLHQESEALAAASKAESLDGGNPVVAHALAMFYTAAERPDKAAPLERRFAESAQSDGEAMERAAGLFLNAGDAATAAELAHKAIARHDSPAAEDTLGKALAASGDAKEALPHFERAWQLGGQLGPAPDAAIAFDYAQALLTRQSFTEAAEVASRALASEPHNAQMQLVLGVARYGQRRFDEAIAAFLETIRIDPSISQPYLFLSNLLEQAGAALDRVIAADEAWAAREPANGQAQLTLAKALLQKDRKSERARDLLRRAMAANPEAWEPHYQLGVLFENSRDYANAATELKRSIELNPKHPLPHYHLARVYDRLGQTDEARREREIHGALAH